MSERKGEKAALESAAGDAARGVPFAHWPPLSTDTKSRRGSRRRGLLEVRNVSLLIALLRPETSFSGDSRVVQTAIVSIPPEGQSRSSTSCRVDCVPGSWEHSAYDLFGLAASAPAERFCHRHVVAPFDTDRPFVTEQLRSLQCGDPIWFSTTASDYLESLASLPQCRPARWTSFRSANHTTESGIDYGWLEYAVA